MRHRVARIDPQRLPERGLTARPVPSQEELLNAEGRLRFRQERTGLDCSCGGAVHPILNLHRFEVAADSALRQRVRNARPGERVIRIHFGRPDECLESPDRRRRSQLVAEVSPLQVEGEGFLIRRLPLVQCSEPFG